MFFVEINHADGLILLLSKFILIVPSMNVTVLTIVVLGCYTFDVLVLPIRTVDVLVAWYLPHFARYALNTFISFLADIVNFALGKFLGTTYASNFGCILHLFITDAIGKLKQ